MEFASSILVAILISVLTCFLILHHTVKKLFLHTSFNLPPGNLGLPVVGETLGIVMSGARGDLEGFISDRMKRYSTKVFKTSILGESFAAISDPSDSKVLFSYEKKKLVRPWIPRSIVNIIMTDERRLNPGEEVFRRRKLLANFLKPEAVRNNIGLLDETTKHHMDSDLWAPNSGTKICHLAKNLTFALGCRVFMGMGHDMIAQIDKLQDQFEMIIPGLMSIPLNLPGTPYRKALNAASVIRGEFMNIIRSRRKETVHSGENNFLSHLLSRTDDEGKLLSDKEIADMLIGMHVAHHTTNSLLSTIPLYLADHPHVCDLARKEQVEIRRSKGGEKLLTWEDTKSMKYCRNVLNEVLRIAPPAIGAFKEVLHDISFEGFTIPKGWKMYISFDSTHNDPEYFPNPKEFDPTRFEGNNIVPNSFIPFSGGPRMCSGYEYALQAALVFMHNLLINFKWEKLIANEKIIRSPFTYPAYGLPVKLQRHDADAEFTPTYTC